MYKIKLQSQNASNPLLNYRSLDRGEGGRSFAGWPDGKETVISGMLRVSADRRRPRSLGGSDLYSALGRGEEEREDEKKWEGGGEGGGLRCYDTTRCASIFCFRRHRRRAATRTDKHDRKIEILLPSSSSLPSLRHRLPGDRSLCRVGRR